MSPSKTPAPLPIVLLGDIKSLIEEGRRQAATAVNMGLTLLYWRVGQRINAEILQDERAAYGEQIVATLSRQLTIDYGRSFGIKNLRHMMRFAAAFPDGEIVSALSRQLSWSHFLEIIYQKDPLKRDFYAEMCRIERWSVRALRERMGSMLFERTAIAQQPETLIRQELDILHATQAVTAPLVLKDPYLLDFLGLQDRHLERDLEDAILRELENFLLELGAGFSFIARQKRIQIDNDDFYIDLLLYNRKLKRLVAIDLKMDDFRAEHKGQMELYLRWLAKYETESGEAPPIGIILCTGKKQEQIELLELDASGIHVAEYLTVLPPPEVLHRKLHEAIETARARIEANEGDAGQETTA
jgi:predicted nuclease of restriction endonuclease-like (RecB) superfamily